MKIKNTSILILFFIIPFYFSCKVYKIKNEKKLDPIINELSIKENTIYKEMIIGSENIENYLEKLKLLNSIAIVSNQSSLLNNSRFSIKNNTNQDSILHVVDFLLSNKIKISKIFALEHGFRGTADAGENINNGKDSKTNLPIISIYGKNKKPSKENLLNVDAVIFDIQDVGVRFYTYISSLHYIMEACAENDIKLIIFDKPNPNIDIIDGPTLEKKYESFVGMHQIPILHGMTIGEYAKMINGQKWLKNQVHCNLEVIPMKNYSRNSKYSLPVKPSPNLPNDQSINLYASLCLFEGTNVSVGRGTNMQFQIFGSPFLSIKEFNFIPKPNIGAKEPLYNDQTCYGKDLTNIPKTNKLELKWLIDAYNSTANKSVFFNDFFNKLAGNSTLKQQIIDGISEDEIRKSWEKDLQEFKKMREKYLIYN